LLVVSAQHKKIKSKLPNEFLTAPVTRSHPAGSARSAATYSPPPACAQASSARDLDAPGC